MLLAIPVRVYVPSVSVMWSQYLGDFVPVVSSAGRSITAATVRRQSSSPMWGEEKAVAALKALSSACAWGAVTRISQVAISAHVADHTAVTCIVVRSLGLGGTLWAGLAPHSVVVGVEAV